ncbi:MAG: DMT family transporter [Candidatus Micrarchaeota archaeon]|nr:DMT family transporter [Candidatus Micrarchaeota archaeon]
MFAYILAVASAVFAASNTLITRRIMREFHDHWAFSLAVQISIMLALVPAGLVFGNIDFSLNPVALLILFALSILWASAIFYSYKAHKTIEAGSRAVIQQTKTIWAVSFSVIFLKEALGIAQIAGISLIIAGSVIVSMKSGRIGFRIEGEKLTLLTSFLGAVIALLTKTALAYYDPFTLTVLTSIFPTIPLLFCGGKKKKSRIYSALKKYRKELAFIAFVIIASDLLFLFALLPENLSVIAPIRSLHVIFVALGGFIFLKERSHAKRKLVGITLAFLGSVLM